ncbi:MAG: hypothetical protein U5J78_01645 [Parasphingorhabdus sp.]|nr:hypothetical protein [Parasphingorhabdus sp.]
MTDIFFILKCLSGSPIPRMGSGGCEELSDTAFDNPGWLTRFGTLKDRLEHHMKEEEEEIFAAAKKDLSAEKAKELGKLFEQRKPKERSAVA